MNGRCGCSRATNRDGRLLLRWTLEELRRLLRYADVGVLFTHHRGAQVDRKEIQVGNHYVVRPFPTPLSTEGASMTADIEHEAAFIRAFIIAAKQERLAELLAKPKRRRDVLGTLYHFKDLDARFMTMVPRAEQTANGLESLLRARGAPELCYAISTDENLDGRTVPLRDAISQITRRVGHGTLLSCVPGQLGYFQGEEPRECYLLERRGGESDKRRGLNRRSPE